MCINSVFPQPVRPNVAYYSNPGVEAAKVMEKAGFECVRTEGDDFVYVKPGVARPVVIPDWDEAPVFIIKNNLRTAEISRDEFFEFLSKV